jgi:hypothetical protein
MKKIFLIILSISLIYSCVKEVDISDFKTEDKLVISSYSIADSTFKVYLSKTRNILDTLKYFINDADVNLYDQNNILLETLQNTGEGIYTSSIVNVEQGKKYKVETNYNNETVSAEDIVPENIAVSNMGFTGNFVYDDEGRRFYEIELTINDNPNVENYYEINAEIKYTDSTFFSPWSTEEYYMKYTKMYLSSVDRIFLNEDYPINGIYSTDIFSDKYFQSANQKLKFYYGSYFINAESVLIDHILKIEFRTVSKNYYLYKKSLMKHLDNQYSDFWYGVANPVQLYSNVKNGYGIFAGFSTYTDSVSYTSPYKKH